MAGAIWPVKAPSLCQSTSWPEMATLEPFTASTAVDMAVNGGAEALWQGFEAATSGREEERKGRVYGSVLYIFQLPGIRRRRFESSQARYGNVRAPRPAL